VVFKSLHELLALAKHRLVFLFLHEGLAHLGIYAFYLSSTSRCLFNSCLLPLLGIACAQLSSSVSGLFYLPIATVCVGLATLSVSRFDDLVLQCLGCLVGELLPNLLLLFFLEHQLAMRDARHV